jgi:integrase
LSTVSIQRRQRRRGITYPIYYKEPFTGKKKYYKTFPRHKDAQQAANDLRTLLDAGKLPGKKKLGVNPLTFKKTAESLKEEWKMKLSCGDLKEKTYIDYSYWLDVLNRIFPDRLLCQITKSEIEILRNTLASELTKVSSNKYLFIIKQVFKHGLKLNAIVENQVAEIHGFSEKDHERKEFLLPQKLEQLIAAAEKTRAKFYLPAAIYLGAEHGASKQEALSLEWGDIDFDYAGRGLIMLFRTKNKKERVD